MESSINNAIKRGFLQQVRFLIEYGHSVNERDELNKTPLINCALIDDESWGAGLARLLIEKEARITLRDKRGLNALHYACVYNRKAIVVVYLKALDFDLTLVDKFGNTALHYAANVGNLDICKLLIDVQKRYLLPTDIANRRRETPLILAWKKGHLECGQLLVDECNADKDQKDINGISAKQWYDISLRKARAQENENRQRESQKRPRTATARLERLATPKGMSSRPTSALLPTQRRRNHVYAFRQKENMSDDPVQLLKNSQTNLYKPASYSDLRNKPEYVFQLSPADCFTNQARYPMSELSRARSTTHMSHIHKNEVTNNSWRQSIKSFFTTYDYQFSHSFCKGAVPPDPDSEPLNPEERVGSPTPTHVSEQGDSEVGSVVSLKKMPKKLGNAFSAVKALTSGIDKNDKRRPSKQEKTSLARKISASQAPSRNG